jgi:hypothetical protein
MGAALGILGSLGGTALGQYLENRTFKRNKKWWKEQFDYAAAYETPAAQVGRLKEAGLNPALMYGGGQSGGGSPTIGSDGAQAAKPTDFSSLGLIKEQAKNLNTDVKLKQSQSGLIEAQTSHELSKMGLTDTQAYILDKTKNSQINLANWKVESEKQTAIGKTIDNYVKDQTKKQQVELVTQELQFKMAQIENLKGDTALKASAKALNEAKTKLESLGLNKSVQSAILLAITKLFGLDGTNTNSNAGISGNQSAYNRALQRGDETWAKKLAKQQANRQKFKQSQDRTTRGFGKRSNYGPKF